MEMRQGTEARRWGRDKRRDNRRDKRQDKRQGTEHGDNEQGDSKQLMRHHHQEAERG